MGACRKKPAQPASGTLSWMTPSETLLRLCLGGFGDMKWAWGGGWRLPAFLCQTTSSPGFCPISRAHFRDRKTLRKRVHHKGPPLKVVVDALLFTYKAQRRYFHWNSDFRACSILRFLACILTSASILTLSSASRLCVVVAAAEPIDFERWRLQDSTYSGSKVLANWARAVLKAV